MLGMPLACPVAVKKYQRANPKLSSFFRNGGVQEIAKIYGETLSLARDETGKGNEAQRWSRGINSNLRPAMSAVQRKAARMTQRAESAFGA